MNTKLRKVCKILLDILEVYIPAVMFGVLFVCFILGIIFRYLIGDPQSWTFELSSICYLAVGVLSWGIAHREEDNVVFDMLYIKLTPKTQCVMRLISNLLITVVAAMMIMPSVAYIQSMAGLTAQTMPIPRGLIFVPFTVSFVAATVRSAWRFAQDMRAMRNGDYVQNYGKKEVAE